ncbi:hypothetical protein FQN57_001947 [Myotisia sp. PD_48]|nr:hypothetical protein FQN57_001947 [Myotisia sp. PD_48]
MALCQSICPREVPILDVQLSSVGNTEIRATVTNFANSSFSLLTLNSLLSSDPIRKVYVRVVNTEIPFEGISLQISTTNFPPDVFTYIGAGQTIESTFDLTESFDMSASGEYMVLSSAQFIYAAANQTTTLGVEPYRSNTLLAQVDGDTAKNSPRSFMNRLNRRTQIQNAESCTKEKHAKLEKALQACSRLALSSSIGAQHGSLSRFKKFFNSKNSTTRTEVAHRYLAISDECDSKSPKIKLYCQDDPNFCSSNALSYSEKRLNAIVTCPGFYDAPLQPPRGCKTTTLDVATSLIHDFSHFAEVYDPPTRDLNFGPGGRTSLRKSEAVSNAAAYQGYIKAVLS